MKKFFIFLVLIFLIISCKTTLKNDWQRQNLKGKVKFIKQIPYEVAFDKDGTLQKGKISENFSENVEEFFYPNGFFNEIRYFDAEGNLKEYNIAFYDAQSRLTERHFFNENKEIEEKIVYLCDKKGNIIEKKFQNLEGLTNLKKKYIYNKQGQAIEEYNYDQEGNFIGKASYTYDPKHKKVNKSVYYDSENVVWGESFIRYNAQGDYIEEKCDLKNSKKGIFRYEYTYDAHENWIKKVEYQDNEPQKILERSINYY